MKRNLELDYLRIFLSLLVISLHIIALEKGHDLISNLIGNGIDRIAVPTFFVINGYFLYDTLKKEGQFKKYILRVFLLYVVWMLIYLPFYAHTDILSLVIVVMKGYYHLWYLNALFAGTILLYVVLRLKISINLLIPIGVVLYLTGWMMQKINLFSVNAHSHLAKLLNMNFMSRNFLFMAFPCLLAGIFINEKKLTKNIKTKNIVFLLIVAILILIAESYWDYRINPTIGIDFYLPLLLIGPCVLILCLKRPLTIVSTDILSKVSGGIYFLHPLFISLLTVFLPGSELVIFLAVSSCTVFGAFILYMLNKKVNIFL